jgi:DNA polymerase
MRQGNLILELPSKRWLVYRDVEIVDPRDPRVFRDDFDVNRKKLKDLICFNGTNQKTGKWGLERTYGGKLVENITQAVARDVMARALAVVALKYRDRLSPVLTVHDEIVTMFNKNTISEADAAALLNDIMCMDTGWSDGLPTAAGVYTAERYRK